MPKLPRDVGVYSRFGDDDSGNVAAVDGSRTSTAGTEVSPDARTSVRRSGVPKPEPLPPALLEGPVTVDDVRSQEISTKVLRRRRFAQASRGVYLPRERADDVLLRAQGILRVSPPGSALSHHTAATADGLPLPIGMDDWVHVTTPRGVELPRREGVVGHSMELPADHVTTLGGMFVTTAARTTFDLASSLGLVDLVALGDAALRRGLTDPEELARMATWGAGRRGVRRFEKAVELMDPRLESPPESALRVWFRLSRLPAFDPNADVWDDTQLVACVDLLNREFRVAVEYEGAYHRTRQQYAKDILRRARLAALGFEVVQIEANMMRSPRAVVLHVAGVLQRRGWKGRAATRSMNR